MGEAEKTRLRCPRCRSRDLYLTETNASVTTFNVRNGLVDRMGYHEPGCYIRLEAQCALCTHRWKVRRAIQVTDVCQEIDHADR